MNFIRIYFGVALLTAVLFVPRAFAACTVVPYTSDASTVLLDHFDSSTSASFNGSLPAADCSMTPSTEPSYAYHSGQNGLGKAITLTPPAAAGSMSYLRYPTEDILCQANGTIEFWVYPTAYGFELADQGQYYNACSGWTFRMGINASGNLFSADWDFSGCWTMTSSQIVPLNAWSHVAVTWGSTGAKLYLNGVQVGNHASTDYPASGFGGYLMMPFGSPASVNCTIDELRISNVQKTSFNLCAPPSAPTLALPADTAKNIPVSTTLSWNVTAGADSYTLQVSDSSTFSSFAVNQSGIITTSSAISGLLKNKPYYWRVNAKNTGGTSAWSSVWSFTTIAPSGCTIVPYTSDANTVLLDHFDSSTSASFNGSLPAADCSTTPSTAPSYVYRSGQSGLGKAITLNPPAAAGSMSYLKYPTVDILCQANGTIEFWVYPTAYGFELADQGQYYNACWGWTFRMGINASGYLTSADWDNSGCWSMTSSQVVPLNAWSHAAVTWGSAGAKLYLNGVQVGNHASTDHPANGYGGYLMMPFGSPASVSCSIDELRVSNVQRTSFNVCAPPSVPTLALPADTAKNIPVSTTVSWNAAAGADSYTLQVSDSSLFSSFVVNQSGITTTSCAVSGLSNNKPYYWRVNAKNTGGTSAWSSVWSFTTVVPSGCTIVPYTSDTNTVLLDHFDNSTSASFNAYIGAPGCGSFTSTTPSYAFISGQSGFGKAIAMSPPAGQPAGSASFLRYPTEDILCQTDGTIEFWVYPTARGHNSLDLAGQGQYYNACMGWTFRIMIDTSGHLMSSDWDYTGCWSMTSSQVVPLNAWSHVAVTWGSTGAKLYLNGEQVGNHSSTDHPASGFGGYLMMCCGTNAGIGCAMDELRISDVQKTSFNACAPPVGVFSAHHAQKTPGLISAWPNPMRNKLLLNFNLCQSGRVAVEIYSCNGTLVKRLMNETREAGVHTLAWDGCDKTGRQASAGLYFMRITLGDKIYQKQIAIMR